jgi:hypothetical protein
MWRRGPVYFLHGERLRRLACGELTAGEQIDNLGHMAETSCMLPVSFALFMICKGSLQTG